MNNLSDKQKMQTVYEGAGPLLQAKNPTLKAHMDRMMEKAEHAHEENLEQQAEIEKLNKELADLNDQNIARTRIIDALRLVISQQQKTFTTEDFSKLAIDYNGMYSNGYYALLSKLSKVIDTLNDYKGEIAVQDMYKTVNEREEELSKKKIPTPIPYYTTRSYVMKSETLVGDIFKIFQPTGGPISNEDAKQTLLESIKLSPMETKKQLMNELHTIQDFLKSDHTVPNSVKELAACTDLIKEVEKLEVTSEVKPNDP